MWPGQDPKKMPEIFNGRGKEQAANPRERLASSSNLIPKCPRSSAVLRIDRLQVIVVTHRHSERNWAYYDDKSSRASNIGVEYGGAPGLNRTQV